MTRDDILRIAKEADVWVAGRQPYQTQLERFADRILEYIAYDGIHTCHAECQRPACVREAVKAERNKLAQWMIARSYATGHGDTLEDLLKELEWQVRESEREACAQLAFNAKTYIEAAAAIRARGEK
jgi:hypothetical protein